MLKTNYHTHSTFCDGKDSLESIVQIAIKKNFNILGFSSHSMFPFSSDWHIPFNSFNDYTNEVNRLKEIYKDKIKIYLGFEADYIAGVTKPDFETYKDFSPDFLIGSVHFIPGKKGFIEADAKFESVTKGINEYFNGNVKKAVQEYFSLEREMLEACNFTFLGHPDLITKQNSAGNYLFDENANWYKKELKVTAKAIAKSDVCVEINTGGICRAGMKFPYPSPYFLSLLNELNVPVTINSDCHSAENLDYWFEQAIEYIKKSGYKELAFYEDGLLKFQKIN